MSYTLHGHKLRFLKQSELLRKKIKSRRGAKVRKNAFIISLRSSCFMVKKT